MYKLVFILIFWSLVVSERAGREDWIDPNDMINFDPATKTMRNKPKLEETTNEKSSNDASSGPAGTQSPHTTANQKPTMATGCPPQRECRCDQAGLPLTRQYVKSLVEHLHGQMPHGQAEDYNMYITLTPDDVAILKNFILTGNQKHIHDVNEILMKMTNRVVSSKLGRIEKAIEWFESKIGVSLHRVLQILSIGGVASLILVVEVTLQIHWRRRLWQLIVLMFIISIPWTWYELLKQAEIKQQSFAMKDVPAECRNGSVDYWATIKSYFLLQDDKCHAYYEHIMIDPIIKVPPTKAIAVTFVRFFLAPLKDVGSAVSEFIRALLLDLPLTLYPVAIAVVAIFSFMFLFMWFGYSVRLPFFLTIERPPQLSVADSKLNEALTASTQQLQKQLEEIANRLESSEANTADKLRQLEKVQHLAIEYSMSSAPSTPQASPTVTVSRSETIQPNIELVANNPANVRPSKSCPDQDSKTSTFSLVDVSGDQEIDFDRSPIVKSPVNGMDSLNISSEDETDDMNGPKVQNANIDTLMPSSVVNSE